jgi:phenylpropionate dioxygenase-like ring-hydroxylating dioxygenase large terminal subunit
MPDTATHEPAIADARTTPAAVWTKLEGLKGEALTEWRMADLPGRPSAAERNLDEPFPFGWFAVCYSDELAAGEVKPVRYFARELVVWRGEDGQSRVLDAYCRHLGAHMGHGGRVNGNDLECPFHAWQYDETGAVTRIPYARTIPPKARRENCVRSWKTVERNGFVYVWYHPDNLPPLFEVDTYPEVGAAGWTPFKKFEWRVFNSLSNMHDNGQDMAHFFYVHRTAMFPESETVIEGHRMRSVARAKLGTPRGEVNGAITSENSSPGQGCVRFTGISETLLVSAVTPVAADEVHVRFAFTQPEAEAEGPMGGLARALIRDIAKQLDQDKIIWDRLRHEPEPLMCDGDGPVPMARERYAQFLSVAEFERWKGKTRRFESKPKV